MLSAFGTTSSLEKIRLVEGNFELVVYTKREFSWYDTVVSLIAEEKFWHQGMGKYDFFVILFSFFQIEVNAIIRNHEQRMKNFKVKKL